MSIKRAGLLIGGAVILGIIAGILTKNVLIGIVFVILVGGFGMMWRYIRRNERMDTAEREHIPERTSLLSPEPQQEKNEPPVEKM
ncbi:TPA: hypothetical protein GX533_01435 [Candidatus Dojkabacteria bacterium]|uniref:Uncharacterized protein n=1 Tax=Candidatus Dojkabacteria bacterium TaxID=2099670 RepID=A0A832R8K4_9BACT|nr:hypothetical protein [Candidatus Dojkabacteria bacterium]